MSDDKIGNWIGFTLFCVVMAFLASGVTGRISAGSHGSRCYPNMTCDSGLYCLKEEGIGTHCIKTKVP